MIRYFLVFTCLLLCNSCCNKKICPGDELPGIVVKIAPAPQSPETVILYTLENEKVDSTFFQIDKDNSSFRFFPMNDFDDNNVGLRQFVIRYNNKSDTAHHISAVFKDVEFVCDSRWGCGRGLGTKKTTIKKLIHFSFLCQGKTHSLRDTVRLSW
jgi:hypothetical protein